MGLPLTAFVSHSHFDNEWCRSFVKNLHDAGIDVWYDEKGISGGAQWMATIEQELQTRDVFLLVMTPDAWASDWVQREIQLALVTKRIIIPIMVKKTPISGFLLTIQFIAATNIDTANASRMVLEMMQVPATPAKVSPVITPTEANVQPRSPIARLVLPPEFAKWGFQSTIIDGSEVIIPPLVTVPAGTFIMGSDTGYSAPKCTIDLPEFRISQFPVTVAEYFCAFRAKSVSALNSVAYKQMYYDESYQVGIPSYMKYEERTISWQEQRENLSRPIVGVNWAVARTYAKWLQQLTGQPWRLPTEAEWEKAASLVSVPATYANFGPQSNQIGKNFRKLQSVFENADSYLTLPPSSSKRGWFKRSDANPPSDLKIASLLGNAWEWTSSEDRPYPYEFDDGREEQSDETVKRIARGGSFLDKPINISDRRAFSPQVAAGIIMGLRLVIG